MAITPTRPGWRRPPTLRDPDPQEERHPSWLELFFDLCFVAAVAALAADLHHDPTWGGIARFCGLFVPVWWAWMGYTWYASAFDNDDAVFRVSWFAAMGLVIAMAAGVDTISTGGSGEFAVSYAALQLLLAALFLRARRHAEGWRGFAGRYAAGDALGGAIWLASAAVPEPGRYLLWAAGMVVLMGTPPLAVVAYEGKAFDAAHIAERYGLFTLIVLGESVVAASAALAAAGFDARSGVTAALGFAVAAAIWWIYFDSVRWTALGREGLRRSFTWGYGHLLVFAGIAATAVGVHLAADAAQHHESLDLPMRAIAAGGLVAYLLALAAIQHVTVERFDRIAGRRLLAAAAVAACAAISAPIALIGALAAVMAVLAWAESG